MKIKKFISRLWTAIVVLLAISLFAFLLCFPQIVGSKAPILHVEADDDDIEIELYRINGLDLEYKLKPDVDIKNLQLTFEYFDNEYETVKTIVKNVGDVRADAEYDIDVSLLNFQILELFQSSRYKISVTDGYIFFLNDIFSIKSIN